MTHSVGEPLLREVTLDDAEAVSSLERSVEAGSAAADDWERLWKENPASSQAAGALGMGWVLAAAGRIVGYLGSVPLLYRFGERTLVAAATRRLAVHPDYRTYSLNLLAAFARQPRVDLWLCTSASEATGKILALFRFLALPQDDYDRIAFDVLEPRAFSEALLRKLGASQGIARGGAPLLSTLARAEAALRRRGSHAGTRSSGVEWLEVDGIDASFDDLFERKAAEGTRLLGWRSAGVLRWHFGDRRRVRPVEIGVDRRADKLVGFVILARDESPEIGLVRSKIVDLVAEGDEPEIVDRLVRAARERARADGCHVLEAVGFPASLRRVLLRHLPHRRKFPAWPYFYKAGSPELAAALRSAESWYPSLFDGDASL
jgi:hypothetical protein